MWLLLVLLLLCASFGGSGARDESDDDGVRFLSSRHSRASWARLQAELDDLYSAGKWIHPNLSSPSSSSLSPAWGRSNYDRSCSLSQRFTRGDCVASLGFRGYRWRWQPSAPDDAPIESWSPSVMCKLASGRDILFLGDSLNEQLYLTWVSFAWAQLPVSKTETADSIAARRRDLDKRCHNYCPNWALDCEGPAEVKCPHGLPPYRLHFKWSKHLHIITPDSASSSSTSSSSSFSSSPHHAPVPEQDQDQVRRSRGPVVWSESRVCWTRTLRDKNISILILNAGAHYMETPLLVRNVEAALNYTFTHHPNMSVVFRSTTAGHAHCDKTFHSPPLSGPQQDKSTALLQEPYLRYHWKDLDEQNAPVAAMLSKKFPQVLRVNIHNATSLRADSHPNAQDCLHSCFPGVIDDWLLFVFNALARAEGIGPAALAEAARRDAELTTFNLSDASSTTGEILFLRTFDLSSKYDGQFVRFRDDRWGSVYHVTNGSRHFVPDAYTLAQFSNSKTVTQLNNVEELKRIPVGRPYPHRPLVDGTLVAFGHDRETFLFANGSLHLFSTLEAFAKRGYDFKNVVRFPHDDTERRGPRGADLT